jgi:hypothetical protein
LFDEDTLWLFPCFVKGLQGVALPDTGATKNYVSRIFAQKPGVPIENFLMDKHVTLAGGQKMTAYGKCRLPLQLSGWQWSIEAIVMDLNAEFDLVLRFNWKFKVRVIGTF